MTQPKSFLRQFLNPHGWVAVVMAGVTVIFVCITRADMTAAYRLATEGVDTTALVTDRHWTTSYSKTHTTYHYHLAYRFKADGKPVLGSQEVSQATYDRALIGDVVAIRYWKADPALSELELGANALQALYGQIATGTALLATLAFAIPGLRRARHASWMRRHGVRREFTVKRLDPIWYSSAKAPRMRLVWDDPDGFEARSWPGNPVDLPKPGEKITVLTDPDRRRRGFWSGNL